MTNRFSLYSIFGYYQLNSYYFILKIFSSSYISSSSTSTIISISTGVPKGSMLVPMAERACFPFSPNIFINIFIPYYLLYRLINQSLKTGKVEPP